MFTEIKNSANGRTELINKAHVTKLFYVNSGDIRINLVDGSYVVTSFDGDIWELLGE